MSKITKLKFINEKLNPPSGTRAKAVLLNGAPTLGNLERRWEDWEDWDVWEYRREIR